MQFPREAWFEIVVEKCKTTATPAPRPAKRIFRNKTIYFETRFFTAALAILSENVLKSMVFHGRIRFIGSTVMIGKRIVELFLQYFKSRAKRAFFGIC